jgi:hypothetical protein
LNHDVKKLIRRTFFCVPRDKSTRAGANKGRRAELQKLHREVKGVLGKFEAVTRDSGRKLRESVARAKEGLGGSGAPDGGNGGGGGGGGRGVGGGPGGGRAYDPAEEERQGLLERSRRQQLLQSENEIAFNESVIAEREEGIREVEATVGELAEIFKDIAVLVNEQGQMIDDIDANVGNAAARTEAAVDQLKSANKYQKRSRNKMCMIMIFLLLGTWATDFFFFFFFFLCNYYTQQSLGISHQIFTVPQSVWGLHSSLQRGSSN